MVDCSIAVPFTRVGDIASAGVPENIDIGVILFIRLLLAFIVSIIVRRVVKELMFIVVTIAIDCHD